MEVKEKFLEAINSPHNVDLLIQVLGISKSTYANHVKVGVCSNNPKATYKEQITDYLNHISTTNRKRNRGGSIEFAKTYMEIKLLLTKEKLQLLEYRNQRNELVDREEFFDLVQPFFKAISEGLIAISRNYPESNTEIRKLLNTWVLLGEKLTETSEVAFNSFVKEMEVAYLDNIAEDSNKVAQDLIKIISVNGKIDEY